MRAAQIRPACNDWPALAQDAASFADFLEKMLASEHVARDPLEAHISNAADYIRHSCSVRSDLGSDLEETLRPFTQARIMVIGQRVRHRRRAVDTRTAHS
ncbi:MAG: hypothetical protein ABI612_04380 [Betaproteobacteria bacterium]